MIRLCVLLMIAFAVLRADEPKPETLAAFDRYVKLTEDGFAQHRGFDDFLWLDHHSKEKTMVWLQQSIVQPMQTLDNGKEIEVSDGVIQHWLGAIYAENATLDQLGGVVLNWQGYKDRFPQQITDSKLTKHDGAVADILLRFYKKQFKTVVLNVNETCTFFPVDQSKWWVACRSSHIGEAEHPGNKKKLDEERAPEDQAGHLWRLNFYWRVQQSDNGCYAELEVIALQPQETGRLHVSHYMANFQNFPHELAQYIIDTLPNSFPHHR